MKFPKTANQPDMLDRPQTLFATGLIAALDLTTINNFILPRKPANQGKKHAQP